MSLIDSKSRVVSFRLSNAEYEAIEKASRIQGFGSMALFARAATLSFQSWPNAPSPVDTKVAEVWRRIDLLTSELEKITNRLRIVSDNGDTGYPVNSSV